MNTQTFRDEVEKVLRKNAQLNRLQGRRKGDSGYLIASHADIADELGLENQRMVDRLLGGARDGTDVKLITKSRYIKPIREMLGLQQIEIAVPVDRAEVLVRIAGLPENEFAAYREAISAKSK